MTGSRVVVALVAVVVAGIALACEPVGPTRSPGDPIGPTPVVSVSRGESVGASLPGFGAAPPDAALLGPAGEPVVGQLGSYTWGDSGSDSPWLPGSPAPATAARSLLFALSRPLPVDGWSARYAPPGDPSPARTTPLRTGAATLEVQPPPPGTWTVALTIDFGQGAGSATWYWRLDVR